MPYLIAAYAITLAVIFLYTFSLSRRQKSLRREIETLKSALAHRREEGEEG